MADKELEKEKQRKLTEREAARLANFEQEAAKLEAQGYQKKEMTMSVVKANVMAFVLSIPFIVVALVLFFLLNKEFTGITAGKSLIYFVLYLVAQDCKFRFTGILYFVLNCEGNAMYARS